MAVQYILRNPNFQYLGFSKVQILMLWGDLFYWAIAAINFKECPQVKGKTRYEVFKKQVPNIQEIRLLPIFSVLMVYRHVPNDASIDQTNDSFYQYALYVGPDMKVRGAIRAAVITNNVLQIIVTTKYKAVSDCGSINIYPQVQRGLKSLLEETTTSGEDDKLTKKI